MIKESAMIEEGFTYKVLILLSKPGATYVLDLYYKKLPQLKDLEKVANRNKTKIIGGEIFRLENSDGKQFYKSIKSWGNKVN